MAKGQMAPRTVHCARCSSPFETQHSQGKYCSDPCARDGERASWRRYGARHPEYRAAYAQAYYAENREQELERNRLYRLTPAAREASRRNSERQIERYPERIFARQMVLAALRAGMLTKAPCKCGAEKVQAHHRDYTKPLEVDWLCAPCHRAEHRGIVIEDGAVIAVDGEPVVAAAA